MTNLASTLSNMRKLLGTTISINSVASGAGTPVATEYAASTNPIASDSPDFVPNGPGVNASYADQRSFTVGIGDFPTAPIVGAKINWQGSTYVILGIKPVVFAQQTIAWKLLSYRQQAAGPSAKETEQLAKWTVPTP